jgi:hypothetical protein
MIVLTGEVLLCKGYADNKDDEHLKLLWLREHENEILKYIRVEVKDGGEKADVLLGGICG